MKKVLSIGLSLVLVAFMSASALVAQEKAPPPPKEKAGCMMDKSACPMAGKESCEKEMAGGPAAPKLTPEQKAKVEELRTNLRLKLVDLKAEQEKLAIQLKQEMRKDEPSMQAIGDIIRKLTPVREKIQLATIENRLEVRKILGPQWREAMKARMDKGSCAGAMGGMEREESWGEDEGGNVERRVIIRRGPMAGGDAGMPMDCCPAGRGMGMREMRGMRGMAGMGAGCPMMSQGGCPMHKGPEAGCAMGGMKGGHKMQMGAMGGCCAMGGMKGGHKMQMGAMGAGCGMGGMKGGCATMQKGGPCRCMGAATNNTKIFRPYGKGGAACRMGEMKGGCEGMNAGAPKEMKRTMEIRKES